MEKTALRATLAAVLALGPGLEGFASAADHSRRQAPAPSSAVPLIAVPAATGPALTAPPAPAGLIASPLSPAGSTPQAADASNPMAAAAAPAGAAQRSAGYTDPHAAAASSPGGAAASLESTVAALGQEQAKPEGAPQPSAAQAGLYDGAGRKNLAAGALAVSALAPGGFAVPAAYSLLRYGAERRSQPKAEPRPWSKRVADQAETHLVPLATLFLGAVAGALTNRHETVFPLIMAGLGLATSAGMQQILGETRQKVVGGWQASHDQKYRTDYRTGELRDIRGQAYGSDRYEAYAKGPVSAGEKLWSRAMGVAVGALFLANMTAYSAWVFSAALTLAYIASDLKRQAPRYVPSDEDRDHAGKFGWRGGDSATASLA